MNVASGYSVASNYGNYGAEKTSPTNTKPFTMPLFIETPMIGVLTFVGQRDYNPFKDIAETGSVNFPKLMQTKATPTRSDEEILRELEELAKEHARTGQYYDKHDDERYLELMDEYISSVSPDRAGILKSAVAEINERLNPQGNSNYSMSAAFQQIDSQRTQKEEKEEKEPIDYFLEALKNKGKPKGSSGATSTITKNGSYHTETIDYGGGRTTTLNYVNGEFASMQIDGNNYHVGGIENGSGIVRFAEFYDDNGEKIMSFNGNDDGGGLRQAWTEAEAKRNQEIGAVYNAAYDIAIGKRREGNEMYNKAYERLTSGSVA